MNSKMFFTVFVSVFLAEIGDKTQLATMLFSAQAKSGRFMIFVAAALALTLAAAIGVLVGEQVARFVSERTLKLVAGSGFICIGLWTLWAR